MKVLKSTPAPSLPCLYLFYFIHLFCTYFINLALVFFLKKESWLYKGYGLEVKLDSIPRRHKETQEGTSPSTPESNQTFPGCHQ